MYCDIRHDYIKHLKQIEKKKKEKQNERISVQPYYKIHQRIKSKSNGQKGKRYVYLKSILLDRKENEILKEMNYDQILREKQKVNEEYYDPYKIERQCNSQFRCEYTLSFGWEQSITYDKAIQKSKSMSQLLQCLQSYRQTKVLGEDFKEGMDLNQSQEQMKQNRNRSEVSEFIQNEKLNQSVFGSSIK